MAVTSTSSTTNDAFALFTAFIKKRKIRIPKCTVCNTHDWQFEGLKATLNVMHIAADNSIMVDNKAAPMAHLLCLNCSHVLQFAWLPILREVQSERQ